MNQADGDVDCFTRAAEKWPTAEKFGELGRGFIPFAAHVVGWGWLGFS
jgi:hypothetical protein